MNKSAAIKIYVALFLLIIPGFLSVFFPELSGDSQTEIRTLQDFPKLPNTLRDAYKWPRRFDQFASDRFPFRSGIIRFAGKTCYKMGFSISPEILIGNDGWLFLLKNCEVLRRHQGIVQLSTTEIKDWVEAYIKRKDEIETNGAKLYFIIVPDKHTIYKNQIPNHFSIVGKTITDQLVHALVKQQVTQVIDLRPVLQKSAFPRHIYDKYDSHWNDIGAYTGYKEIMDRIDPLQDIPRVTSNDISFKKVMKSGGLAWMIGNTSLYESTFEAEIFNSTILHRQNYENKKKYETEEWISISSHKNSPVVICLCDSFVNNYLYKYLEQSFSKTIFKHHRSMTYDKQLIEKYHPEIVMYIVAERLIPFKLDND